MSGFDPMDNLVEPVSEEERVAAQELAVSLEGLGKSLDPEREQLIRRQLLESSDWAETSVAQGLWLRLQDWLDMPGLRWGLGASVAMAFGLLLALPEPLSEEVSEKSSKQPVVASASRVVTSKVVRTPALAVKKLSRGEAAAALGRAAGGTSLTVVSGISQSPDALRIDSFCRLASAALQSNRAQEALKWTEQGLQLAGKRENVFVAKLWRLQGEALRMAGQQEAAAESFARAIAIHEQLLEVELEGK